MRIGISFIKHDLLQLGQSEGLERIVNEFLRELYENLKHINRSVCAWYIKVKFITTA